MLEALLALRERQTAMLARQESELARVLGSLGDIYPPATAEEVSRHRCGCEVCATSSQLCPATISGILLERQEQKIPAPNVNAGVHDDGAGAGETADRPALSNDFANGRFGNLEGSEVSGDAAIHNESHRTPFTETHAHTGPGNAVAGARLVGRQQLSIDEMIAANVAHLLERTYALLTAPPEERHLVKY